MKLFVLNLIVAFFWPVLVGSLTADNLIIGFILGYLILYSIRPMLGSTEYFRKLPLTLRFIGYFMVEMIKANVRIAWDVVTPQKYRQPGIVGVPLDVKTDIEITLLSNLITLTPGSMAIDISPDRKTIYIHSMFVEDADSFRKEIKEGFERRVLELLR
ncbi:MAG: Na+/H+ antiporter subunit E [Oligoflexus sp.]